MELEEFRDSIQKKHTKKTAKVRNSFGVYDAYKIMRKEGWYNIGRPVKENEYYKIIREINSLLAKEIAEGNTVVLPARMGKLELRKQPTGVSIVNGNLKITYPIDWSETIKLWFEDEEARRKKTLLRNETKQIYRVKYDKYTANYENKSFYQFALNRFIKKALKENINQGKIDTLW